MFGNVRIASELQGIPTVTPLVLMHSSLLNQYSSAWTINLYSSTHGYTNLVRSSDIGSPDPGAVASSDSVWCLCSRLASRSHTLTHQWAGSPSHDPNHHRRLAASIPSVASEPSPSRAAPLSPQFDDDEEGEQRWWGQRQLTARCPAGDFLCPWYPAGLPNTLVSS